MTDIDWCREHGIAVSTFYYWVKQLRKEAAQIPAPAYGHSENPRPKQDVVPIDIVPERFPVQHTPYLDNPHTLEMSAFSKSVFTGIGNAVKYCGTGCVDSVRMP